jgi:ubiquitin C-terminal hydrolase
LNQGHYTAICKNDGNWVSYNDSVIKIVDNPVTKNAYVLFYKMKNIEENNSIKEGK